MLRIRDVHNGVVRDMSADADAYNCMAGGLSPDITEKAALGDSLMDL